MWWFQLLPHLHIIYDEVSEKRKTEFFVDWTHRLNYFLADAQDSKMVRDIAQWQTHGILAITSVQCMVFIHLKPAQSG